MRTLMKQLAAWVCLALLYTAFMVWLATHCGSVAQ